MRTHRGRPRELTRPQIRHVLRWHRSRQSFQTHVGSLRDFARRSGIPIPQLRRALAGDTDSLSSLSPESRARLTHWMRRYRRFSQYSLTAGELAAQLGVSRNTVYDCVRRRGHYQQSPRSAGRPRRDPPHESGRLSQQATKPEIAARAIALRQWPKPADTPQDLNEKGGSQKPIRRRR